MFFLTETEVIQPASINIMHPFLSTKADIFLHLVNYYSVQPAEQSDTYVTGHELT